MAVDPTGKWPTPPFLAIGDARAGELRIALRSSLRPDFDAPVPINAPANPPLLYNADMAVAVAQRLDLLVDLRVPRVRPGAPPPVDRYRV